MEKISAGKRLYEQVVERFNGMIEQGRCRKGELLPREKELMEMMEVSRITVREARRLLNEAGVIQTLKGKGSYVLLDKEALSGHREGKPAYPKSFLESTDVRVMVEPAAARYVAFHADEGERRAIGDHLSRAGEELEDFHKAITRAAHNGVLVEFFDTLLTLENAPPMLSLVPPFRQKRVTAKLQTQHEKIYEAIRDGNGGLAYFYMLEHMRFVKATYEGFFHAFY